MSKRRHALNPAKVKAEIAALQADGPEQAFAPRLDIRRRPSVVLLCLLSGALLLISFTPFDRWWVAYFALVPWGLGVVGGRHGRWALLWAWLAGVAFWGVGLYWLTWITLVGYIPLILFLGAFWLPAAWLLRRSFLRGWPAALTLPLAWVAMEYLRAYALSGFPWFYLAHSQYTRTRLIQIADVTGPYGVSFFVALVNGAIVDALAQPLFVRKEKGGAHVTRRILVGAAVCVVVAAGMIGYGAWRIGQQVHSPGPVIGVVQEAYPISLFREAVSDEVILRQHLNSSLPLAEKRCDLVVWPESMLGALQRNPKVWMALDPDAPDPDDPARPQYSPEQQEQIRQRQADLRQLRDLLERLGCPLLAGAAMYGTETTEGGRRLLTNSAMLLDLDEKGQIVVPTPGRYDKVHLVPFSEYVPFRYGWPWLHRLLRKVVPEEMPQLQPGRGPVTFTLTGRDGPQWRLATPICYEGVFARECRRMVRYGGGKADVLVNMSNDGWFIYQGRKYVLFGPQVTHASTELDQHLVQYVFRAIENRVPVVRAVNTGISAHVDSNGRILQTVCHQGDRKMVGGRLVATTVVDGRVSLYSRMGDVFALAVSAGGAAMAAVVWRKQKG